MFRTTLANATVHRTCRPLIERHTATPFATFLNPAETGDIYSGMVAMKTGADLVSICDGAVGSVLPFGLFALDKNPSINDTDGQDMLLFAIWQGGPDAYFTIDAPAFDTAGTYSVPTDGTSQPLYAGTAGVKGKLTSVANGPKVAQLIRVVSATRIEIRLAAPTPL